MNKCIISRILASFFVLIICNLDSFSMQINVRKPDNSIIILDVEPSDSFENIRAKDAEGYDPATQILIFSGHILEDGRTLSDYGIMNGDTIHLSFATTAPLSFWSVIAHLV